MKNGLTIGGLIVIAALGYYLFVLRSDSNTNLASDTTVNEARLANDQFLRELNQIKSFRLSNDLFVDVRFQSFVDFSEPLPTLEVGRENPFAPVE